MLGPASCEEENIGVLTHTGVYDKASQEDKPASVDPWCEHAFTYIMQFPIGRVHLNRYSVAPCYTGLASLHLVSLNIINCDIIIAN